MSRAEKVKTIAVCSEINDFRMAILRWFLARSSADKRRLRERVESAKLELINTISEFCGEAETDAALLVEKILALEMGTFGFINNQDCREVHDDFYTP